MVEEEKNQVNEVLASTESPVEETVAPVVPEEEKGRAEPNEAFFGTLLLGCLILSLLLATGYFGFAGYRYFKQVQAEKAIPSIDALPKAEVAEAPKESTSKPAEEAKSETAASTEKSVTIDKATLVLKVLNGGAAKGVAGTYAEKLKQTGFSKVTVGNSFGDYTGQTLYYAKGQEAGATAIKEEVSKTYSSLAMKEAPTGNKDASVATYVLILGR